MRMNQKQFVESHPLAISLALGVGFLTVVVLEMTWWESLALACVAFVIGLGLDRSK